MRTFVKESKRKENTSFSYLYLANGVGAVFGTVITAVYLIEKFGFSNTLMFGALCNFSLAIICLVKGFYVKRNLKIQDQDTEKKLIIPLQFLENQMLGKVHF